MKNITKRTILLDLKRVFFSWQFYLAISIIVLGSIITYNRNLLVRNLDQFHNVGTLNTFIYSNIVANNIVNLLAPVIAGLVFSTTIIDDMKTGMYGMLASRTGPVKYIRSKIISSVICGGGVFLISYLLIFILIVIIDPTASVRTEFYRNGLFGLIYDRSMLLYCFAYIGYTFIFGAVFSLVCLGVAMITKNKYMAVGLPFFLYYISEYAMNLFTKNISDVLHYFLPHMTFDIIAYTPTHYVLQLMFSFVIATILISLGSKSLFENGRL